AGTGKTRVLTTRIAHILLTGRAHPGQILAVTFTNKAAREMKERIGELLQRPVEGWWLGTFHALAARILRRHAERIGLQSNFTILDEDDQLRLLKQILATYNFDDKAAPPRLVNAIIQRWKDKALTPDQVTRHDAGNLAEGKLKEIYTQYQARLLTLNACDFGDMLLHCITLFQKFPDVLLMYQNQFTYLLVDEYQDANVAQYLWLRLLAQTHKNLCVVGDDDQSIYGWRGAEVRNILRFEEDFPGAAVVRLEQNYRSTGKILEAASGVIANNSGRLGKTLWTDADQGQHVRVHAIWDADEEARFVADEIETLQRRKTAQLSEMAILVRASFQTREFEERFLQLGIPYRVYGGLRFYERLEIRDALAYLRAVMQPRDDLAFERIINTPKRGLGDATLQTLHRVARGAQIPLQEAALRVIETDELKPKPRSTLRELMQKILRWRGQADVTPHTELAQIILEESGYTEHWLKDKSPEAAGRLENLKELISAMGEFHSLEEFLEHVSLVMENNEQANGDMVTLMTLHSSKGLEFPIVFLPGWEEGIFPSQKSLDENGVTGLEEERRLAYVGITRARMHLYITYAGSRRVYGQWQHAIPSRFISELPNAAVEHTGNVIKAYETTPRQRNNSPGNFYQRALPAAETYQPKVQIEVDRAHGLVRGARVFHQKFGMGTVRATEHDKVEVKFDHAGTKKVMASFVKPA
ncbi:MAG TPA: DNA helicase II, partial [Rhodospirillaceae bacterium]|nr:DNA helicase II [Rhodospirillaceae bacterium]